FGRVFLQGGEPVGITLPETLCGLGHAADLVPRSQPRALRLPPLLLLHLVVGIRKIVCVLLGRLAIETRQHRIAADRTLDGRHSLCTIKRGLRRARIGTHEILERREWDLGLLWSGCVSRDLIWWEKNTNLPGL